MEDFKHLFASNDSSLINNKVSIPGYLIYLFLILSKGEGRIKFRNKYIDVFILIDYLLFSLKPI